MQHVTGSEGDRRFLNAAAAVYSDFAPVTDEAVVPVSRSCITLGAQGRREQRERMSGETSPEDQNGAADAPLILETKPAAAKAKVARTASGGEVRL